MMTTNLKKEKDCAENRVWRWRRLPPQTSLSVPVGLQTQLPLNTSNRATYVQKWPYAFSPCLLESHERVCQKRCRVCGICLEKRGVLVCRYCSNKISQTGWLTNSRNWLLVVQEAGKFKVKVPAWSCSGGDPFPGSWVVQSLCVLTWGKGQGSSLGPCLIFFVFIFCFGQAVRNVGS